VHLIQEIGSYAGLAAIPGLAILSALYFSQARDVRRLRDWAGRAPERTAEAAQGGRVVARPAPQTAAAQQPAAAAAAARTAAAAGGGGTATATRPATAAPPGTHPPVPRVHTGGQTTILGAGSSNGQERDPWYRRAIDRLPAARYIAIVVVGIAVVGGGIAYGLTQMGSDSSPSTSSGGNVGSSSKTDKKDTTSSTPSVQPADVSVAVLNGTTTNGLASSVGTKLEQQGFKVGNEDNSNQGQVNESVVLFKPGKSREAALVRRRLRLTQIEPADQQSLAQSGGADVIVVLGSDLAQGQSP
jgi:LytR cell envelope-related transcriptional attenuator